MIKVNINKSSVSAKLQKAKDLAEERAKDKLEDMAEYLVAISPVSSGAYVLSHSILPSGNTGGRLRQSNSDVLANVSTTKNQALAQLKSDIEGLSLDDISGVIFRNRAAHATDVETGNNWRRTQGYWVYSQLGSRFS
jgi:hypothetical protein